MSERQTRPSRERQRSEPAPSEVNRFLATLQEQYLEPLARADPRPSRSPAETRGSDPERYAFVNHPPIDTRVPFHGDDDETLLNEPQGRDPRRERGGQEEREQTQRRASGRDTLREQGSDEQRGRRAQDAGHGRQGAPRSQQGAQPHSPQDHRYPPAHQQHPFGIYHPVPHVTQLPCYPQHAAHSGLNVGEGIGVPPPPPRYDPVPVGTYIVRLARNHGQPVVGIWRAGGGGRWTPVVNLEGAVGELVLLPPQQG